MISVENERNFENMLFADASALPPPQDTVTPWHTAMHYILWGLGLTTITLRFLNLDVILTAVGAALLVLGFRILRRENTPLRWGFRLSLASFKPEGCDTMICINDEYADGRDMSWLWDVDFTSLRGTGVKAVSGVRAWDMALRLEYDQVPVESVSTDLEESVVNFVNANSGTPKHIYCTYTAMLKTRAALAKIADVADAGVGK